MIGRLWKRFWHEHTLGHELERLRTNIDDAVAKMARLQTENEALWKVIETAPCYWRVDVPHSDATCTEGAPCSMHAILTPWGSVLPSEGDTAE